jgi:Cdc6-like AAA superfamily ATPase
MADFAQTITTAYATDGAALDLGRGVHDGAVVTAATVKLPLRMVNRHGLIAGATGTGKTKTLQGIAEQLPSAASARASRSGRPSRTSGRNCWPRCSAPTTPRSSR